MIHAFTCTYAKFFYLFYKMRIIGLLIKIITLSSVFRFVLLHFHSFLFSILCIGIVATRVRF